MRKSEFRELVKECVRECLREIMQEQLDPGIMQEAFIPRQDAGLGLGGQLINPYDTRQMQMRQEIAAQQSMLQNAMRQQAQMHQPQGQGALVGLDELAGVHDPSEHAGNRYAVAESGYRNPSDYNVMAVDPRQQRSFNTQLDTPVGGSHYQQQPQQRQLLLDPTLDTPMGGGEMRPPDANVMASIMNHTMHTTLQEQAQYGHTRPGSHPDGGGGYGAPAGPMNQFADVVSQNRPEDLFPNAANWAMLALD